MNTTYYRIPIYERVIEMTRFPSRNTCLHIDSVGVFILHDSTQELTTDAIRHYLPMRRSTYCVVEAESVSAAIQKFYDEWDGAKTGGEKEQEKALWIDRVNDHDGTPSTKVIEELPPCSKMHRNKEGSITCGRPIHSIEDHEEKDDETIHMNGEFGMCGLEGYDYPEEDCPMEDYLSVEEDLPIKTVTVNGMEFRYTSWKDAEAGMKLKREKEEAEKRSEQIQETMIFKRLEEVQL